MVEVLTSVVMLLAIGTFAGWVLRGAWEVEKAEKVRWESSIREWERVGDVLMMDDYELGARAEAMRHHLSNYARDEGGVR